MFALRNLNPKFIPNSRWCTRQMLISDFDQRQAFSTKTNRIMHQPHRPSYTLISREEYREFMSTFPYIVKDLTKTEKRTDFSEVMKRYADFLNYNVPTGKNSRAQAVLAIYKKLERPDNLTPENIRLAHIMAWCVEMLNAFILVADDIMDNSEMRRGSPCWYRGANVGLKAIADVCILEQAIFELLKKHFSAHCCYLPAIELFHEAIRKTTMGQILDMMMCSNGIPNLDQFTMKKYNTIVKYKTTYFSFQLPIALAMHLADAYDNERVREGEAMAEEVGLLFQIQDDFLDCFGDSKITGKLSNDIRDGKCSWLAVVALEKGSPTQRKIMEKYYGKTNPEAVEIIRNIYEDLDLRTTYAICEEERVNRICTQIQQASKDLPHKLVFSVLLREYGFIRVDNTVTS